MVTKRVRVLIVDDSALMRKALKEIINTDPALEVVGTARDGYDALEKMRDLQPDVVTLDINMPVMDGITSLQHIINEEPELPVLMVSSLTAEGALTTFEALELGAIDYVTKPSGTVSTNLHVVGKEIIQKIKLAHKGVNKKSVKERRDRVEHRTVMTTVAEQPLSRTSSRPSIKPGESKVNKVVVIGISTGGPGTLMEVLPLLPADLKAALLIIQHMPPTFTNSFANRLNDACAISIKEAEAGDVLENGKGYLAPGGYQMVIRGAGMIRLTSTPKTLFIPSVDVTMESVLNTFSPKQVIGVLMTGMGDDGAEGMVKIRRAGGMTIAEDESTAVVFGMPREAIERGGAELVVPSYRIPEAIIKAVNKR